MTFVNKKPILPDADYGGLTLRRRKGYADKLIIHETLQNGYEIPLNVQTVIDIGAHIGTFSLLAVKMGAVNVYAFEPEQFNFEVLLHNVEVNNAQDKVHCIKKGVGIPGSAKLYIHPTNSGMSTSFFDPVFPTDGPRAGVGFSLDQYQPVDFISIREVFEMFKIEHCDLLKLDCEGSEIDIISDIDGELAGKIAQISVEIHEQANVQPIKEKLSAWFNVRRNYALVWIFDRRKK